MANVYKENGFKNRQEYLEDLADNMGVGMDVVGMLADVLGPGEDFDGLVSELEDYEMMYGGEY